MSKEPDSSTPERREVHYSGRVQGVGFRYVARNIAERHLVAGYVHNLTDGRVLLVVEGTKADIDSYLEELRAELKQNIRGEESITAPPQNEFIDFSIKY
jgi:acylphosphatase